MTTLHRASQWDEQQVAAFLEDAMIPLRLAFNDAEGYPRVCSLWFLWRDEALWSASHGSAFAIKRLQDDPRVSFEVSTNDYPYKGVRGKGRADLLREGAADILDALIDKYLGDSNRKLASWLRSRADQEFAIRISPEVINSWDFSSRMSSS